MNLLYQYSAIGYHEALIPFTKVPGLYVLPTSQVHDKMSVVPDDMVLLVDKLVDEHQFDYVLIDCPAGIDVGFMNAITPAKEAVIVTTPEITAIRDADRVTGLLESNNIFNVKLLINRVRPDMIKRNDMMSVKDVQEMLSIPLLGAVPEDTNVIVATNRGEPLVLRKKLTLSGIAFENAARRLIGRQDYMIDLDTPYKGPIEKVYGQLQNILFGQEKV